MQATLGQVGPSVLSTQTISPVVLCTPPNSSLIDSEMLKTAITLCCAGINEHTSGHSQMCSAHGLEACTTGLNEHPFRSAMSDFTNVPPKKLAFYLFSKGVIKEEDYQQTKQLVTDPNSDPEEINMENLMKAYDVLRSTPMKIGDICSALEKLHKEVAQKLAADSELCKSLCRFVGILI